MNKNALRKAVVCFVSTIGLVAVGTSARAVTYTTTSCPACVDGPVSASAVFTLAAGSIQIDLSSLQANPTSAGQLVSGILFEVTDATGPVTSTSRSGLVTNINTSNDTFSTPASDPLTRWVGSISGNAVKLTTLSGGNPDRLIVGPPNSSNLYSNANASIFGDNPNVYLSALFTLFISGITPDSTLSKVAFMFGTSSPVYKTGLGTCLDCLAAEDPPSAVPLPAAIWLFGAVLVGTAGVGRWRRKRAT